MRQLLAFFALWRLMGVGTGDALVKTGAIILVVLVVFLVMAQ